MHGGIRTEWKTRLLTTEEIAEICTTEFFYGSLESKCGSAVFKEIERSFNKIKQRKDDGRYKKNTTILPITEGTPEQIRESIERCLETEGHLLTQNSYKLLDNYITSKSVSNLAPFLAFLEIKSRECTWKIAKYYESPEGTSEHQIYQDALDQRDKAIFAQVYLSSKIGQLGLELKIKKLLNQNTS